jgi:hypothetical protein
MPNEVWGWFEQREGNGLIMKKCQEEKAEGDSNAGF